MSISSIGSSSYYTSTQLSSMQSRTDTSEIFSKTDEDGSGSLDTTEFASLISKLSEATGQDLDADELFSTYDADGNGVLSEDETTSALEANRPEGPPPPPPGGMAGPPPDLSQIVSDADEDEDGSISATEAESLASMINDATGSDMSAEDLIAAYDEDEDGVLSEDETIAALEANRPEGPPPPPPGGMSELSEIVSDADEDGDGSISATEAESLASMINEATGSDMSAEDLIAAYDEDEDGVLSEDETIAALEANRPEGSPPPPEGMAGAGIDSYLKAAAMAQDSSQTYLSSISSSLNIEA